MLLDTIKYKEHTIAIHDDPDHEEDRRDWDNLGTIIGFHNRYNLGDDHDLKSSDFSDWDEIEEHLTKKLGAAVILPVYLLDHSGLTVSTTPFSCSLDSGQLGFIYTTRDKILKEYGKKVLTKKLKEQAAEQLKGEVKDFDQCVRGEFYRFIIDPMASDPEESDVDEYCNGFFDKESAIEDAKASIDRLVKLDEELELIATMPLEELPKYVNHKWDYVQSQNAYLKRLNPTKEE